MRKRVKQIYYRKLALQPIFRSNARMINFNDFQHQAVRDLTWALFSPSIISGIGDRWPGIEENWIPQTEKTAAWLTELDANSEQLYLYLNKKQQNKNNSFKLGIYFENLLSFFFENHPDYELLGRNIKVNDSKRTLGEFDFIYYDKCHAINVHHEVAVKFYLQLSSKLTDQPWSRWLGPGCLDRFDIKLLKMLGHQSHLSDTPEGQIILKQLNVPNLIKRISLKGCLFSPYIHVAADFPYANQNRLSGQWCYVAELEKFLENEIDNVWLPLRKQQWLAPLSLQLCPQISSLFTAEQVTHFAQTQLVSSASTPNPSPNPNPIMFLGFKSSHYSSAEACQRLFVVPNHWPW